MHLEVTVDVLKAVFELLKEKLTKFFSDSLVCYYQILKFAKSRNRGEKLFLH